MVETTVGRFNEGTQKTLLLKSDQWGIFGPTFRTKIPVTALGDGQGEQMYKITKEDWDATIGPVFDRMAENIGNRNKIDADKYRAIANGYLAMESGQTKAFHQLLCSFAAAADPEKLKNYPGTVETNKYLARLTEFVDMFNSPENAVLISQTQLQGLANAARGAMEYAEEGRNVADSAKEFYETYEDKERVQYSNGLVNALT